MSRPLQVEHCPHPATVLGRIHPTRGGAQPGKFQERPAIHDRAHRPVGQGNDERLLPLVRELYGNLAAAVRGSHAHEQFRQIRRAPIPFTVAPLMQLEDHVVRGQFGRPGGGFQKPVHRSPVVNQHPGARRTDPSCLRARRGNRALRRRRGLRRMVRGVIRHIGSRGGGAPIVWPPITAPAPDEPPLHPYRWGSPYNLTRFRARFQQAGEGGACLHSALRYADASRCSVRQDVCRC